MEEHSEIVTRRFNCKVCGTTHEIKLNKKLAEDRNRYPFHHIYLHGDLKDILTILYIDKELQIRGVETEVMSREDIFSKEHMVDIIEKLVNEIEHSNVCFIPSFLASLGPPLGFLIATMLLFLNSPL